MKKAFVRMLLATAVIGALAGVSQAAIYTFQPTPSSLWGLDPSYSYKWGINLNLAPGEHITEAVLTYKNIYDWQLERGYLYTHLLDSTALGTNIAADSGGFGDGFAGQGIYVDSWIDPVGGSPRNFDLVYTFSSLGLVDDLQSYVSNDGVFGFGIDPDAHFWNDGVSFKVTTAIPEPATFMLFGMGLLGFLAARKKFFV